MPDDLDNRGPQDRARVAMNEDHEVEYWTRRFSVSRERLREAVDATGDSAQAVANFLHKKL